jgi:uncharacterized Tic20 family protein
MKNKEQATRIKELRNRQGFSQEELSAKSGLSLRTIQRIENGETEPRGDSLKRLAITFGVSPDEITDWQIVEDNSVLSMLNLSQLGFLAFPILGIIIPLTIWILKKDKIKNVDRVGKSILNFQITWTILLFMILLFMVLTTAFSLNFSVSMFTIILIISALYLYNITMIIMNTVRSSNMKEVYYNPALKILR